MDSNSVVIISDASIKNNVTTSISHIHLHSNDVKKTIHHAVNITSTEAKLFAIRYGINQAVQILNISYIIVITNVIHLVRHIFDSMTHPYQIQSIAIAQDLRCQVHKCHLCGLSVSSILLFIFIFIPFYFLFLEQLGLELIGHAVTSVTT